MRYIFQRDSQLQMAVWFFFYIGNEKENRVKKTTTQIL